MAIKITVHSSDGINVNSGAAIYLEKMPATFDTSAGNFGYFRDSFIKSKQYGIAEDKQGNSYSEGAALLAGGSLSYDIGPHTLAGKLETLAFGTGLNGVSGGSGVTNSVMSLDETDLTFTGLGLNSARKDKVHDILYGMMTGDADAFLNLLARTAVNFTGGEGDDSFQAGRKADRLAGGAGADTLSGGKGEDRLTGGLGADLLTGGGGKDIFVFKSIDESSTESFDTIFGFRGDLLNLKGIDAKSATASDDAFDFIGNQAFSGKAGELRFEAGADSTFVYGDTDGDGTADLAIMLDTVLSLRERDFVL